MANKLNVVVGANIDEFAKAMKDVAREVRTLERQFSGFDQIGDRLSSAGRTLTLGITAPLAAAGTAATKFAMDVVESENLFEVSMGNMAQSARKWSTELSDALGLNEYELRRNIGTFNVMLSSMGLAEGAAYDMAKGLTQLTYDMASFYNLNPEEAFEKLQAGISGEIEPLKRLGIVVNETAVKTYAYSNGIAAQGEQLTEQQKILARYGVIMEATSKAQGDLARTIESPANQLRILGAQLKEVGAEFGEVLIPMVKEGTRALNGLASWLKELDPGTKKVVVGFAALAAALGPVTFLGGQLLSAIPNMVAGFGLLKAGVAGLGLSFGPFLVGGAIIAGVTLLAKKWYDNQQEIKAVESALADTRKEFDSTILSVESFASKADKAAANCHNLASALKGVRVFASADAWKAAEEALGMTPWKPGGTSSDNNPEGNGAFNDAMDYYDYMVALEKWSTEEQIDYLQRVLDKHAKTNEERRKLEVDLFKLRKQLAQDGQIGITPFMGVSEGDQRSAIQSSDVGANREFAINYLTPDVLARLAAEDAARNAGDYAYEDQIPDWIKADFESATEAVKAAVQTMQEAFVQSVRDMRLSPEALEDYGRNLADAGDYGDPDAIAAGLDRAAEIMEEEARKGLALGRVLAANTAEVKATKTAWADFKTVASDTLTGVLEGSVTLGDALEGIFKGKAHKSIDAFVDKTLDSFRLLRQQGKDIFSSLAEAVKTNFKDLDLFGGMGIGATLGGSVGSNSGATWGSAIGGIVGYAINATLGPIGAIIGGLFGGLFGGSDDGEDDYKGRHLDQVSEVLKATNSGGRMKFFSPYALKDLFGLVQDNMANSLASAFDADTYEGFVNKFSQNLEDQTKQALITAFMASDAIKPLLDNLSSVITQAVMDGTLTAEERQSIIDLYSKITDQSSEFFKALQDLGIATGDVSDSMNALGEAMRNVPTGFKVAAARWDVSLPKYHSGGYVPENGPALLRKGEVVLTPEQQVAGTGGGVHFHFHGTVYGVNDLKRTIKETMAETGRSGSLASRGLATGGVY